MKPRIPPFGLRMPPELHQWVKDMAEKDGRSMNNYVVQILASKREEQETAEKK